jgi:hypothetical protein
MEPNIPLLNAEHSNDYEYFSPSVNQREDMDEDYRPHFYNSDDEPLSPPPHLPCNECLKLKDHINHIQPKLDISQHKLVSNINYVHNESL